MNILRSIFLLFVIFATGCDEAGVVSDKKNNLVNLPKFSLSDDAFIKCKELLANEMESNASLMIMKGHHEEESTEGVIHNVRDGWMIFTVNREQFIGDPIVKVNGLEFIVSQNNLYKELNGKTIGYVNGWWSIQ